VVLPEKFLLNFILEGENGGARIVLAGAELKQFVCQFTANSQPIEPRILAVKAIELAGAMADVRRPAFRRKWDDRAGIGGNGTAARLHRGMWRH
jgi:hypothetical protein